MTAIEKHVAGQKPARSVGQFDIYQDDVNGYFYLWDNAFREWLPGFEVTEQSAANRAAFLSE